MVYNNQNYLVFGLCPSEPFFSEQDRGEGRHLLVAVVLQASQVEVGISRKETGNNAGPIREIRKQAVEVKVKLELDTGSENQVKWIRPTRGS
jgi:hypothetical protein